MKTTLTVVREFPCASLSGAAAPAAVPENLVVYAVWGGGTRRRTRKPGATTALATMSGRGHPSLFKIVGNLAGNCLNNVVKWFWGKYFTS